jgi:chromosome partitioning protein
MLVREIRKARGGGNLVICLVPNRVDVRTSAGRQLEAALADLGESVAPAIHARTALADAFNLGAWVGAYAPQTPAHLEVIALADHVLTLLGQKPGKKRK